MSHGQLFNKSIGRAKIVKRYQNRKLYDTQQSCYVTLDDIAKMIRADEEVMVIDNKTKNDITAATLTQIIFESEKKSGQYAPLTTLRDIIQNENGSMSSYLAKLGVFPKEAFQTQKPQTVQIPQNNSSDSKPSFDEMKQTLEKRVAHAAVNSLGSSSDFTSGPATLPGGLLPDLPGSAQAVTGEQKATATVGNPGTVLPTGEIKKEETQATKAQDALSALLGNPSKINL